jgi:cytochrome c oxidase cbb3-type subunit 3
MNPKKSADSDDDLIRDHTYDGIQEYDKRLPNWWLFTLYGAIVFSVGYWGYFEWTGHRVPGRETVTQQIAELQKRALSSGAALNDDQLWKMSQDPVVVASGEKIYTANCVACHGPALAGGIGANLVDNQWVHGGNPTDVYKTISEGVAAKGMPVWGPVLGPERIAEVVAFIMNHHSPEAKPGS